MVVYITNRVKRRTNILGRKFVKKMNLHIYNLLSSVLGTIEYKNTSKNPRKNF